MEEERCCSVWDKWHLWMTPTSSRTLLWSCKTSADHFEAQSRVWTSHRHASCKLMKKILNFIPILNWITRLARVREMEDNFKLVNRENMHDKQSWTVKTLVAHCCFFVYESGVSVSVEARVQRTLTIFLKAFIYWWTATQSIESILNHQRPVSLNRRTKSEINVFNTRLVSSIKRK